ncbi:nSTAND1 domain-containing NTPase [Streptomyces coffeae]|uniref:nSTAND1 domain-containing NTPase n=1 Tax=Streptomyces coffeae TaxID=621382 RepID=UPI003558A5B0
MWWTPAPPGKGGRRSAPVTGWWPSSTDADHSRAPAPAAGRQDGPGPGRHGDPGSAVQEVVEAFAAQRLIVVGENTAQITHEALLYVWGRLRGWLGR